MYRVFDVLITAIERLGTRAAQDVKALEQKHQDTGWRKIPSPNLSKGYVMIRRIGNSCYINTGGSYGSYDSCEIAEAARGRAKIHLANIPVGFRSKVAVIEDVTYDGNSTAGLWILTSPNDGSVLQMRGIPRDTFALIRPQMLVYVTNDPFPTSSIGEIV